MTTRYRPGEPPPATTPVATRDLRPGMRLLMPYVLDQRRAVRTVARVAENGWVNACNDPLVTVHYAEGRDDHWGDANGGTWDSTWRVIADPEPPQRLDTRPHRAID